MIVRSFEMKDDLKVSFRVPPPYSRRVRKEAKLLGISEHQYARLLLIRQLENADALDQMQETKLLAKAVKQLADSLASQGRIPKNDDEKTAELLLRLAK